MTPEEARKVELKWWRLGRVFALVVLVGGCACVAGGAAVVGAVGPVGGGCAGTSPSYVAPPAVRPDAGAAGPMLPGPPTVVDRDELFRMRLVRFTVGTTTGPAPVREGADCAAEMRHMVSQADTCSTYIYCGREVLREDDQGFVECRFLVGERRDVTANDPEGRARDGDGTMVLDTTAGEIVLEDLGWTVRGAVRAIE